MARPAQSDGENDEIFSVDDTPLFVIANGSRCAGRTLKASAAALVLALPIVAHGRVRRTYYFFFLADDDVDVLSSSVQINFRCCKP